MLISLLSLLWPRLLTTLLWWLLWLLWRAQGAGRCGQPRASCWRGSNAGRNGRRKGRGRAAARAWALPAASQTSGPLHTHALGVSTREQLFPCTPLPLTYQPTHPLTHPPTHPPTNSLPGRPSASWRFPRRNSTWIFTP
jgi:hypothetical protein